MFECLSSILNLYFLLPLLFFSFLSPHLLLSDVRLGEEMDQAVARVEGVGANRVLEQKDEGRVRVLEQAGVERGKCPAVEIGHGRRRRALARARNRHCTRRHR